MTYSGQFLSSLIQTAAQRYEENTIDKLTFASYSHNRRISPEVSPERWRQIYANADEMEKRFQEAQ